MVTSKPTTAQQADYKTQIVETETLAPLAIILAWAFGVIIPFIISTLGNYVSFGFNGNWTEIRTVFRGDILLYAVGWQVASTLAQFAFKAMAKQTGGSGWWIAYIVALLVSVVPSVVSYYGLASARIIGILSIRLATEVATAITGLIIAVVCTLFDMLPEWIAVEG